MSRNRYTSRFKCGHEGCSEWTFYEPEDREHYLALQKHYGNGQWRCIRHSQPDEVLSAEQPKRTFEAVSEQKKHGLYWGHSGFMHGPGFKAWAKDFPPGTIIRVTAEVIVP